MIRIEMLPASYGDAIWLSWGEDKKKLKHALIDTGFEPCAQIIRQRLHDDPKLVLELFVLTHIDADHIEGSVFLLQDENVITPKRVREIWFNGWEHINALADDAQGALQGEYFSALIRKRKIAWNKKFKGKAVCVPDKGKLPTHKLAGGMKLTLLSPGKAQLNKLHSYWTKDLKKKLKPGDEKKALKLLDHDAKYALDSMGSRINVSKLVKGKFTEDKAPANGSSIAFLAEYGDRKLLFTGDAYPSVLAASLGRLIEEGDTLALDVLKLAHHGSAHNTGPELLDLVRCEHALVSSDGKKFSHPDASAIARVIHSSPGVQVHFNYQSEFTKPWLSSKVMKAHGYTAAVGDEGSLVLELD